MPEWLIYLKSKTEMHQGAPPSKQINYLPKSK
jgi:hypothetical protein